MTTVKRIWPEYMRLWTDLRPEEQKALEKIGSVDDMKEYKLLGIWDDDHLPCFGIEVNGIQVGFWWYEWNLVVDFLQNLVFVQEVIEDWATREYSEGPEVTDTEYTRDSSKWTTVPDIQFLN